MADQDQPADGGETQDQPADGGGASGGDPGKEAAYWRRQAEKHKTDNEKLKKQSMTELERVSAERDEHKGRADGYEAKDRARSVREALMAAATKAGSHDPDAVAKLAAADGSFEHAEDGSILGIEKAIKSVRESKGYLFGPAPKAGVGSGGGRSTNGGTGDKSGTASSKMDGFIRKRR